MLAAVRLARQVASGARDLLHAMYLKGVHRSAPAGLTEMMDEYNSTRDQFKDSLLALRVLGPSWAVEAAQRVDLLASRLTELAFVMQKNLTSEQVKGREHRDPAVGRPRHRLRGGGEQALQMRVVGHFPRHRTTRPKGAGDCSAGDARPRRAHIRARGRRLVPPALMRANGKKWKY